MNQEMIDLRLARRLAPAVALAILAGILPLSMGQARAENNVAPAIVLRQQVSDGATAPAAKAMQQVMADASQSQSQGTNTKTETK